LEFIFRFVCPYLEDPVVGPGSKYIFTLKATEDEPLCSMVQGGGEFPFPYSDPDVDMGRLPRQRLMEWFKRGEDHDDPFKTKIVLMTLKGRLFILPPDTLVRDIWPGVKYPRAPDSPFPFQDLQSRPRLRPYEPDGAAFTMGHSIDLALVPNEKLEELYAG
jgi:hypothetical protein